ncbi:hypothetical protein, partial [Actinospica sp.]|uniref:hypothetical protein n=1 Tax=Actinospica sp. TaxID=1872142 RepID=UPI002C2109FF
MKKLIIGAVAAVAVGTAAGCGARATIASVANQADAQNQGTANTAAFVQPAGYSFTTVDDPADPTFNQLLGINQNGIIAGYFGSGAAG